MAHKIHDENIWRTKAMQSFYETGAKGNYGKYVEKCAGRLAKELQQQVANYEKKREEAYERHIIPRLKKVIKKIIKK